MKRKRTINLINIIQTIFLFYIIYSIGTLNMLNWILRIIICFIIFIVGLILILRMRKSIIKRKLSSAITFFVIYIIIFGVIFVGTHFFTSIEDMIHNIAKDKYMEVNSSFIVLKNSDIEDIKDLKDKKIGLLTNKNDYEGHILPLEALEKNKIDANVSYVTTYLDLINGLIDEDYDAVALPKDYKDRLDYSGEYEKSFDSFVSIYNMSDKLKIESNNNGESITSTDPFNILLIGADKPLEIHHHNYDVIILLTINPKTNDIVVTSVYRAAGMYSSCIGGVDLAAHNGWKGWGPTCMEKTVEDFFDIEISHYVMVDFQGFVDLVDTLGGVEAEVPKNFCEQDSKRRFGKYLICLDAGKQQLNGEQALAFARHRKSYTSNGGEIRSKNHITVIKAIAQKIVNTNTLFKFKEILKIIQDNTETDMNEDQLYSLYNTALTIAKNNNYNLDKINIISNTFDGDPDWYYSPAMHTSVGMEIIYEKSYYNIYNSLQAVLYNKPQETTYYSFDLSEDPDYIPKVVLDKVKDKIRDPRIVENLVGKTVNEVNKYEKKYTYFEIHKKYAYSNTVEEGLVISQSIPAGEGFNSRHEMTVVISLGPSQTSTETEQ